uniref:Uncharacterized protein n=1 Tax=Parascaris equorum TaxID=6256 RepID=A0A914RST5_PAREQ
MHFMRELQGHMSCPEMACLSREVLRNRPQKLIRGITSMTLNLNRCLPQVIIRSHNLILFAIMCHCLSSRRMYRSLPQA